MLQSARAKAKDGADVVVGVVETHGRKETEALLDGLEILPRKHIEYKGRSLEEMDLDALIARRPQIALVDELAHTNAPGSRHPKRYLDVEELLNARHQRLHDPQHPAHREPQRRRRADHRACACARRCPIPSSTAPTPIELVDLTPDDLIQRLKEGKVYVPKQAERALEHYFSPGNLTALRELALRQTAERVDEQLLTHMQAHAIPGPWAAGDRILVCVSEDPACRRPRALRQASGRPTARAVHRAQHRDTADAAALHRSSATASPTRCASPNRSAASR